LPEDSVRKIVTAHDGHDKTHTGSPGKKLGGLSQKQQEDTIVKLRFNRLALAALTTVLGIAAWKPAFAEDYTITDLGANISVADINKKGQIALSGNHAFRWDPSTGMQDLGTLGGADSVATAINASGQVAGSSSATFNYSYVDAFGTHPFPFSAFTRFCGSQEPRTRTRRCKIWGHWMRVITTISTATGPPYRVALRTSMMRGK
jgi:probable HAF family extracellular repeat protein